MPRNIRLKNAVRAALSAVVVCCGCGAELPPAGLGSVTGRVIATPESELLELAALTPPALADEDCLALGTPRTVDHQALFNALNQYRVSQGLDPLTYSKTLEAAADGMAADIVLRGFFDHIDPDGNDPPARALTAGFCHALVGENLASGFLDVSAVMVAWQDSPGHDRNMVREDYRYVGIGAVWTPDNGAVWVQEFALDSEEAAISASRTLGR